MGYIRLAGVYQNLSKELGSLLKPTLDGYLPFPVASADDATAPPERPQVFGTARAEDFDFKDDA